MLQMHINVQIRCELKYDNNKTHKYAIFFSNENQYTRHVTAANVNRNIDHKEKKNKKKPPPHMNMCNKISNVSTVQCIHICFRILFLVILRWMTTYSSFPNGREHCEMESQQYQVYIEDKPIWLNVSFKQFWCLFASVTDTMFNDLATIVLKVTAKTFVQQIFFSLY